MYINIKRFKIVKIRHKNHSKDFETILLKLSQVNWQINNLIISLI